MTLKQLRYENFNLDLEARKSQGFPFYISFPQAWIDALKEIIKRQVSGPKAK
jgi:hypothetical protein